jgi:3-hydroxybutyryl-CoA dehydrogenase
MNILVIAEEENYAECIARFGEMHPCHRAQDHHEAGRLVRDHDVVFDFLIGKNPSQISIYTQASSAVFLNTSKTTLKRVLEPRNSSGAGVFFGFNGLPTFLSAPVLEVSLVGPEDEERLKKLCVLLQTDYAVVDDRVGLVTPRVISMIINEAYYAAQEKIASREDIDLAMKLGTNYPYGPFEWCQRIGIGHVYELLEAIFQETRDDRYKACSLMRDEYLSRAGLKL